MNTIGTPEANKEYLQLHRRKKAYHEAGHAVVAIALGLELKYVNADSSNGDPICCTAMIDFSIEPVNLNKVVRKEGICFRGGCAGEIVQGEARSDIEIKWNSIFRLDRKYLFDMYTMYNDTLDKSNISQEFERWVLDEEDLLEQALSILKRHKKAYESVSQALLKKGKLSGDEVLAVMREAEPTFNPPGLYS